MARQAPARVPVVAEVANTNEQRRHTRYVVHYGLRYRLKVGGKAISGVGMLVDVSVEGCGIQGSCPVKQGDLVTIEIQLPNSKVALGLKDVPVMWASGSRFGVKSEECSKIVTQLGLIQSLPRD